VLAVMGTASRRISAIGPDTVVGLVNDLLADPAASEGLVDQLVRGGTEVMEVVVARAVARGEARAGVSARVARLPLDLLRHELILTRRPVSAEVIEEIVDEVFLPLVAVRA
jgi:hypothetical protein